MKRNLRQKQKGSIYAFSLLIMMILLVTAMSISFISVTEMKSSSDTRDSSMAFQVADSSAEKFFQAKEDNPNATLEDIATVLGAINPIDPMAGPSDTTGGTYEMRFYDDSGVEIFNNNASVSTVEKIKVSGKYKTLNRAIEMKLNSSSVEFVCGNILEYAGKSYDTVKIGNQCWLAKNINVGEMLVNGTFEPLDPNSIEKWCYENNEVNNGAGGCSDGTSIGEGGLYTWAEALQLDPNCNFISCADQVQVNHQGICPTGWHIPDDNEWHEIENYYATASCDPTRLNTWDCDPAGTEMKTVAPDKFSALLVGYRYPTGNYAAHNGYSMFWSTTEFSQTEAWRRGVGLYRSTIDRSPDNDFKSGGYSVRCVKND